MQSVARPGGELNFASVCWLVSAAIKCGAIA